MQVQTEVAAKLDGAIAALASLNEQTEAIATGVLKKDRGAEQKLAAHRVRIRETETSVDELRFLLDVAKKTDERAAVEQHRQSRLMTLEKIAAEFKAQDEDAARLSELAEQLVSTYRRMIERGHRIENLTPRELAMRHGFAFQGEAIIEGRAFPCGLDGLVASELFRFSGPGKLGVLPEAKALSMMTVLNPKAAESIKTSLPRVSASLLATMKGRHEEMYRRDLAAVERETNNG